MFSLEGRLTLQQVVEQGFGEIRDQFLEQLKWAIEGLLVAERDGRVAELRRQGQNVYRWSYTVRKCWLTLWGVLEQLRVAPAAGSGRGGVVGEISASRLGGRPLRPHCWGIEPA